MNDQLNLLMPNQSVSPRSLARKTKVPYEIVKKILMELSFRNLVDVQFIIQCDNDDSDMIHAFTFNSESELLDYLRSPNNDKCSHCESKMQNSKIRVAFIKKAFGTFQGENYG
jgi:hypothetical protein